MSEVSLNSPPEIHKETVVTSSLASVDGNSPCNGQAGQAMPRSGPDRVHASHLATPESDKAFGMSAIFGPLFSHSSPSADLQRRLENRLRALLDVNGSPEYELTWKESDMPSGPPICRLRASARYTFASSCGGWPTVRANDCQPICWKRARMIARGIRRFRKNGGERNLNDFAGAWWIRTYGEELPNPHPVLNPLFCLVKLLGIPIELAKLGPQVTRSSRRSGRCS